MKKILLPLLLLIFIFTACTSGSYTTLMSIENSTDTSFNNTYEFFNGYKQRSVNLESGDIITLDITSNDGALNIYITKESDSDSEDEVIFSKSEVETGSFEIEIQADGRYTLKAEANEHSGAYSFSW